jgi:hypothetical protein
MKPWTKAPINFRKRYPALPDWLMFAKAYDFLADEMAVTSILAGIDADTAGMSRNAFYYEFLAREEAYYRFSSEVVVVRAKQYLLPADVFLSHVEAGRPMTDVGAWRMHGFLTHRVQWVMIGRWNKAGRPLGEDKNVGELYRRLASPAARTRACTGADGKTIGENNDLWDDLLDANMNLVRNATSPEFLHDEFARDKFPALFKRWS